MSSKLKIDTRVRSLKNYLEEFERGAFQIPLFQRDFLWEQDDIIELFDSIKNNYPIGSILFWKPSETHLGLISVESFIGPYLLLQQEKSDNVFILDGLQRLSSLFGCLINPHKVNLKLNQKKFEEKFNLYYDLEEERFIYLRQKSLNQPYQVPVYVFMNSIDFRQYARREFEKIRDEEKIELYYDRADEIGQIFNNYQIASVDINYASIEEAVEVFRRVNEKGLPISKDWIVSAITASNKDGFRLGSEIDKLLEELKPFYFDKIKRDIIFQCIQNSFDKIYFDYKIEDLVKRNDFAIVAKKTFTSIKKSVKFLFENLLVLNSKMIPYNSQLIFLTSFFNKLEDIDPTETQILKLKKWFWTTTYSNYFTIYSLSNQRKAYEVFCKFIKDENCDPIFNDSNTSKFRTLVFPPKIYFGSVRAKALALFLLNKYKKFNWNNIQKISYELVEEFEIGNLFSITQRENPSENFLPILSEFMRGDDNEVIKIFEGNRKPKNYAFYLLHSNPCHFITQDMVDLYDGTYESEIEILQLRKQEIINAERLFVESLGVEYSE